MFVYMCRTRAPLLFRGTAACSVGTRAPSTSSICSLPRPSLAQHRTSPFIPPTSRHYSRKLRRNDGATTNKTPAPVEEQPRLLDRLRNAGMASDQEEIPKMSNFDRLFRPFLFTALFTGGCVWYGYTWTPNERKDRWFPDVPRSVATVGGIMALNVAVWALWKIPLPVTWRVLNRYFVSAPGYPYSLSMLGNAFSHQTILHLFTNMFALYVVGTSLCEQIGQGPFLGLYLSGAVISSFGALTNHVLRQGFHVYSLGASGAVMSVIGAYAYLNPDQDFYIIFLPFLLLKARYIVAIALAMETAGVIRGWRVIDHAAHLSGLLFGLGGGYLLHQETNRRLNAVYQKLTPEQRLWLERQQGRR